jgi:hypothetical protein
VQSWDNGPDESPIGEGGGGGGAPGAARHTRAAICAQFGSSMHTSKPEDCVPIRMTHRLLLFTAFVYEYTLDELPSKHTASGSVSLSEWKLIDWGSGGGGGVGGAGGRGGGVAGWPQLLLQSAERKSPRGYLVPINRHLAPKHL